MKGKTCENCGWFNPEGMGLGTCTNQKCAKDIVTWYGYCKLFSGKDESSKVKPRRLCDFCERGKPLEDDCGEYEFYLHKCIPLPASNLTTGEIAKTAAPPFYSMFLYHTEREENDGEIADFPIKFCPCCGRKLVGK